MSFTQIKAALVAATFIVGAGLVTATPVAAAVRATCYGLAGSKIVQYQCHNYEVPVCYDYVGAGGAAAVVPCSTPPAPAPIVTGTNPAPNATNVSVDGHITVTFDQDIDAGRATFTLMNGNVAVPAWVYMRISPSDSQRVLWITPGTQGPLGSRSLLAGTTYTATLSGVHDAVCNPAGSDVVSWSFTTAPSRVASYINRVYLDLFNRAPDPAGMAGWTTQLNNGTPRVAVANAITGSPEYRSKLITGSYLKYLNRSPDAKGLSNWLAAMNRGITISQMESGFIASPEYYIQAGSTDAGLINKLYTDVLGRAASATEVSAWTARLGDGMSRGKVAMGFLLSTERLTTVVNGYYTALLGRNLDPSGQVTWVKKLQAGGRNEAIIGSIIASPEYFNKA